MKLRLYEMLGLVCAGEALFAALSGQLLILAGLVALIPLIGLGWLSAIVEAVRR